MAKFYHFQGGKFAQAGSDFISGAMATENFHKLVSEQIGSRAPGTLSIRYKPGLTQ